jgi:hypothetical protein
LATVYRGQGNVQWSRETADVQHMEASNRAVFVYLFHDLIMSGSAKITYLLFKRDFEEISLMIVPDRYVVFRGHNTMLFVMESVMLGAATPVCSL